MVRRKREGGGESDGVLDNGICATLTSEDCFFGLVGMAAAPADGSVVYNATLPTIRPCPMPITASPVSGSTSSPGSTPPSSVSSDPSQPTGTGIDTSSMAVTEDSSSGLSTATIIYIAVGASAFLLIIIVSVIMVSVFYRRNKTGHVRDGSKSEPVRVKTKIEVTNKYWIDIADKYVP